MSKMAAVLKSRWRPFWNLRWPPKEQQKLTFQVLYYIPWHHKHRYCHHFDLPRELRSWDIGQNMLKMAAILKSKMAAILKFKMDTKWTTKIDFPSALITSLYYTHRYCHHFELPRELRSWDIGKIICWKWRPFWNPRWPPKEKWPVAF